MICGLKLRYVRHFVRALAITTISMHCFLEVFFAQGFADDGPVVAKADAIVSKSESGSVRDGTADALDVLINRLRNGWTGTNGGKAWTLPYSLEMWEIASHKEKAIDPLLTLARDTEASQHAKVGAMLALHLIGVERVVNQGPNEEFKNKTAREAILSLLRDEALEIVAIELLIRDPWESDIDELRARLVSGTHNKWAIVKALQRHGVDDPPVHQSIPKQLGSVKCRFEWASADQYLPNAQSALTSAGALQVKFESGLTSKAILGKSVTNMGFINDDISGVIVALTGCEFDSLGNRLEYFIDNEVVTVCSIETAEQRWLAWFANRDHRKKLESSREGESGRE